MTNSSDSSCDDLIRNPQAFGNMDFGTLLTISRLLESGKGLPGFLQIVTDGVTEILHADRVTLITFDDENILHFLKSGPGADKVVEIGYAELQDGLSGWVLREREFVFSPRGVDDPRESVPVRERRKATGCGDIIVAPLLHSNRMLGTLTAINRLDDKPFTEIDAGMVKALAQISAAVVSSAQTFFKRENQMEELYRLATHDELTKLYNRRMFADVAKHSIANAKRRDQAVALMFLDLDGFKQVNDNWGHYYGDCLLKEVADRIVSCVRESETTARLGGDEFVILFENGSDEEGVRSIARRLIDTLGNPYFVEGQEIRISASAGIAFAPTDSGQYDELLNLADKALYRAKQEGKNRFRIYDGQDA